MTVHRVLFFLALLVSVECLYMAAAEALAELQADSTCQGGEGGSCPSGATVLPRETDGGVEADREDTTDSPCTTSGTAPDSANAECVKPPGAESCPSGKSSCPPTPQVPTPSPRAEHELNAVNTDHRPQGQLGENSDRGVGPLGPPSAPAPPTAPKGSVDPTGKNNVGPGVVGAPAEQVPPEKQGEGGSTGGAAGSTNLPASERELGSGEERTTGESAGKGEGEEAQPSPSPDNSNQESAGDNNANAGNGTKPAEGGSPSNQEGDVGNTDTTTTTTTTTTLPPELTNNKKGDADSSSSSISSSMWVRVPLLIVITLACILVVC
ncbi:uncharacterized protein TM35_000951020 [Trypanosoma theileri]|uniref:Titin n=1 Tax=Trypanosoma theileri TaxID=67003 RepID=A0A1X0NED2_9TRYP|nr:uncharacterized protein TM35_000951020 [Trypanosoma theileri]ORC82237.1 hypothetical protein TM35_000951020 [Trypanosoma theileri]